MEQDFIKKDLIIIGGGPGGYTAAIKGAQLGANVVLIEKDKLGGTCLNRGCIPTKTLHRTAEVLHNFKASEEFGISTENTKLDPVAVHNRCVSVSTQLRTGIEQLMKSYGIESVKGLGSFVDKNTVKVTFEDGSEKTYSAEKIIIATGSVPMMPPIPGLDLEGVMNSDHLLESEEIPESMVVIGGGVIGIEFASIYNAFGTKVTVIEMLPSILGNVDSDITKRYVSILKRKGIDVFVNTKVCSVEKTEDGLVINAEGTKGPITVSAKKVLVAIGRRAELTGLNIEASGVLTERRGIVVDSHCKTNVDGIYSIGDVNGGIMLAHWAAHQGMQTAELALGKVEEHIESPVPGCIFAFPEISTAGLSEDEAKAKGITYKTAKFMFGANGKALAMNESEGFVKVIADEAGRIIGVHIMGPHASDLIHEGVIAIAKGMTATELRGIIHAHPTLGESLYEAFSGIDGLAIHQAPPRK